MQPYYDADGITIYHGDCTKVDEWLAGDVLVTDPPYGIDYRSGARRSDETMLPRSIRGDQDTSTRDHALRRWSSTDELVEPPALVFGTWKRPAPEATVQVLVWDTGGANGMGNLSIPWKPSHQQVYVIGDGEWQGRRTTDVLRYPPVQSLARNGRVHPHQKPVDLLVELIDKCPPGVVVDPFMGSGSTLVAAKRCGRRAIGVELDEHYCEVAASRLAQGVLDFGGAA